MSSGYVIVMSFFEYLITPFLFLIREIFFLGYSITGNYGTSIVFLSFAISALLLPVFILIEKTKKKDDAIKKRMKPFIDEIKRCYKGQERHYYLKTLNRQHNYNPLRSLIPTLSLVLQIPFFIAAYQFLEGFEPLSGTSYLFIQDLNKPDAIFGSVNLLPILMTLVNLLTAYLYTRNGSGSDIKQMVIVAGAFFILLFNMPAGLVFYWTLNNVFSFFRLFITNPEVFKKDPERVRKVNEKRRVLKARLKVIYPKLVKTFIFLLITTFIIQLNSLIDEGFTGWRESIMQVIQVSLSVSIGIGVLVLMHNVDAYKPEAKGRKRFRNLYHVFKSLFFVILILMVGTQLQWAYNFGYHSLVQRLVLAVVVTGIVTWVLAGIILQYQNKSAVLLTSNKLIVRYPVAEKSNKLLPVIIIGGIILSYIIIGIVKNWTNTILIGSGAAVLGWLLSILFINKDLLFDKDKISRWLGEVYLFICRPTVVFVLLFMGIYLVIAGLVYYTGLNRSLVFLGFLFVNAGIAIEYSFFVKRSSTVTKKLNTLIIILNLLQLVVGFLLVFGVIDYPVIGFVIIGVILVFTGSVSLPQYVQQSGFNLSVPNVKIGGIFHLSVFYIVGLIFYWSPLIVYASFPETFSFPPVKIFLHNLPLFSSVYIGVFLLYIYLPYKLRYVLVTVMTTIVVLFFVNTFIVPLNVGSLQLGKYVEAYRMAGSFYLYIIEAISISLVFLSISWLIRRYSKQLQVGLVFLTIVLIVQSLSTSMRNGNFLSLKDGMVDRPAEISFSQEEENVVVMLADAFMGIHMKRIMDESPELKDVYEGFTWYPNTLSVSTNTAPSISSLLGGEAYNLNVLNEDLSQTMSEKITNVSEMFTDKVKSEGYNFVSTRMIYSTMDKNKFDAYLPTWHKDWNVWNKTLSIGGPKELDYTILWKNALFYGMPLSVKPAFYRDGRWIKLDKETNRNTRASREGNFIRLLPYISDVSKSKGCFVYIHSGATHSPFRIIDEQGDTHMNVSPYENNKWFIERFAEWIQWMKDKGVYENTKIILVSDHGIGLSEEMLSEYDDVFEWNSLGKDIPSKKDFWNINALLMVKDFNSSGSFKEDWRLMSNSDTYGIAFDENNYLDEELSTRSLPVFFVGNLPRSTSRTFLPIREKYMVTNSIYNPENWKAFD